MLQEGQANQPAADTGGYSKHWFPMSPNLSVPADGDPECILMKTVQEERRNEGETGDKTSF